MVKVLQNYRFAILGRGGQWLRNVQSRRENKQDVINKSLGSPY